jgi:gas vesicle protein
MGERLKMQKEKESNMNNYDYDYENRQVQEMSDTTKHVLTGIVVGGLIGATAMMLLAPRSGEEMRAEIKDKAMDLRDRTTEGVKETVSQVVSKASHLRSGVTDKSQDLKKRGQDVLIEKLDLVSEAVDAAKRVLKEI